MNHYTKPQLADDVNEQNMILPCIVMPKIDGVRGLALNDEGRLTGRSLDEFKGYRVTEMFTSTAFRGLDGELTLGSDWAAEALCANTTGALGKFKGVKQAPDIYWWIFDYVTPETMDLPYIQRYARACERVDRINSHRINMVPYQMANSREELFAHIGANLSVGFEGTIFRNPQAKYKPGRPGSKSMELMRHKPWADDEMLVTRIIEGETNNNEEKINSLGRTERSSAQAGKVANGTVGSLVGTLVRDVICPFSRRTLFKQGLEVTVGPGTLTHAQRKEFFEQPDKIVGHVIKFQHMTYGTQDLPRFGGYLSHRLAEDMS